MKLLLYIPHGPEALQNCLELEGQDNHLGLHFWSNCALTVIEERGHQGSSGNFPRAWSH